MFELYLKFTKFDEISTFAEDFIGGGNSLAEGIELFKKLKYRFIKGSILSRKWRTKIFELREKLSKHEEITNESLSRETILDIGWDENTRVFYFILKIFSKMHEH